MAAGAEAWHLTVTGRTSNEFYALACSESEGTCRALAYALGCWKHLLLSSMLSAWGRAVCCSRGELSTA